MAQEFDAALYQEEMRSLVTDACARFRAEHGDVEVYTVSIWTDANAAVSAINFDTLENSVRHIAMLNKHSEKERAQLTAAGDLDRAALFEPIDGRNYNPADFAFGEFAKIEQTAFPALWEEHSKGKSWKVLEPALLLAGEAAIPVLQTLRLRPDAELGVNSHRDWFDHSWRLFVGE